MAKLLVHVYMLNPIIQREGLVFGKRRAKKGLNFFNSLYQAVSEGGAVLRVVEDPGNIKGI